MCKGCGASIDAFSDSSECAGDQVLVDDESDPSKASKLATGPGYNPKPSYGAQLVCVDDSAEVFQLSRKVTQLGEVKGGFVLSGSARIRYMEARDKRKSLA